MSNQELYTNMVSFADLSDAVKKLGYESNSYQINIDNLNKLINIPMLVKIENDPCFPHFVVIINYKGGYVLIVAPKKDLKPFKLNTPKSLHFDFRPFSLY